MCQKHSERIQKQISNFSSPVQFCLISLLCSKYFVWDCIQRKTSYMSYNCMILTCHHQSNQSTLLKQYVRVSCLRIFRTQHCENTVISPDFLVSKFCGKAQFPHCFGRIARNYAETVPFHKIFKPGNQLKLRYFFAVQSTI